MNINATAARVPVARLPALEPQNARDDGIPPSCIDPNNLAAEATMPEHCPLREIVAQFSAHTQSSEWGLVAAELIAHPKS